MANIKAQASGNWSATATWAGGVVPVAGDVVYFNSFTVTLNVDASVALLTTAAVTGIPFNGGSTSSNAGGVLNITTARTLTADITVGTTTVVTVSVGGCTINAATSAGFVGSSTTGSTHAISMTHTTQTNNINGNCISGVISNAFCIQTTAGPFNLVGNITALNVNSGTSGVVSTSSTAGTITGNIINTATVFAYGVVQNAGNLVITGSIIGGNGNSCYGVLTRFSTGATLTINGNVTGGGGSGAYGYICQSLSNTIMINGNAIGGIGGTGANGFAGGADGVNNNGTLTLNGIAIGNGYGPTSVGINGPAFGISTGSQAALTFIKKIQYGALGQSPTCGPMRLIDETTNTAQFFVSTGVTKTLSDPAAVAGTYPAIADVRLGTTYANGNNTGTLAVPAAGSVALGVPVGATTGTAILTAANVQTALTSQGLTTARASNLDNLDAAVSSRSTLTKSDVQGAVIPLL